MSDFLFVPLRPFFYAALAKRWKVKFHKSLRKFNNVDSKTTYVNENCCVIYIYIYIIQQFSLKYVAFESTLLNFTQTLMKLDLPTLNNVDSKATYFNENCCIM